ncbi:MAG: alpha-galactosidase [Firmicutes bacterium]|nr:alpha-galactosidase [Bacillota bacterium]
MECLFEAEHGTFRASWQVASNRAIHLENGIMVLRYRLTDRRGTMVSTDRVWTESRRRGEDSLGPSEEIVLTSESLKPELGIAHEIAGEPQTAGTAEEQNLPVVRWHLFRYAERPFMILQASVTNRSVRELYIDGCGLLRLDPAVGGGMDAGSSPKDLAFWHNGLESWSPACSAPLLEDGGLVSAGYFGLTDLSLDLALAGGFVTMGDQLSSIQLGLTPGERRAGKTAGRAAGDQLGLVAAVEGDGYRVGPGETWYSEKFFLTAAQPAWSALELCAGVTGQAMKARSGIASGAGQQAQQARPVGQVRPVWSCWSSQPGYPRHELREEDILHNAAFLKANRSLLPVDFVEVGPGYESKFGDWLLPGERFPHGMRWLADQIRAAGFKPGIWLAPFLAGEDSFLVAEHPRWVLRGEDGKPVRTGIGAKNKLVALDCSHPEVQRWLGELIATITGNWGYEYLKVDYLYVAALEGARYYNRFTRASAYRKGLSVIREAAGDAVVHGCNGLLGPSVGLADAMRIGPDTAASWQAASRSGGEALPWVHPGKSHSLQELNRPTTEGVIRNAIARSFLHRRFWFNDPGALIAGRSGNRFTEDEIKSFLTVAGLSGGVITLGDLLPLLGESRMQLLAGVLPPYGRAAVPLDGLVHQVPELYGLRIGGENAWYLLGVFNWREAPFDRTLSLKTIMARLDGKPLSVDPRGGAGSNLARGEAIDNGRLPGSAKAAGGGLLATGMQGEPGGQLYHVFDFWEQKYHGVHRDRCELPRIPAHGVRLLAIKPHRKEPFVLSTSLHFTQGAGEIASETFDRESRVLRISFNLAGPRHGKVYVSVPSGFGFKTVTGVKDGKTTAAPGGGTAAGRVFEIEGFFGPETSLEVYFA